MTTCAFRKYKTRVEFAADTFVTGSFAPRWQKLYRCKDGIGCGAGSLGHMVQFRNDIETNGFDPLRCLKLAKPDYMFWYFKTNSLYIYGRMPPWVLVDKVEYYAVGSGSELAIGAMANGASPKQAVSIAVKHDENTKGPIDTLLVKFT